MHREERKMSSVKHSYNLDFDKLISDQNHDRLPRELSKAMTRPAYEHTTIEQKNIYNNRICSSCGYYKMDVRGRKHCQFPWDAPGKYDKVLIEFLPCKEDKDEKD